MRTGVAILAAGAVLAAVWVAGPRVAQRWRGSSRPPNLLLISSDTLRADHVGAYGYAAAQTPTLDALARRGLRFAHASTVTPRPWPAHASLMTATSRVWRGARDSGCFYVGENQTPRAEARRARGYRTG